MQLESLVDLYDTDILRIEHVKHALDGWVENRNWRVDLEAYRRQTIERFFDAGYEVTVFVYQGELAGVNEPYHEFVVQINKRVDPKEFDFDRQVHEATHDVLGFGEEGFIPTPSPSERPEKHKHGPSCG